MVTAIKQRDWLSWTLAGHSASTGAGLLLWLAAISGAERCAFFMCQQSACMLGWLRSQLFWMQHYSRPYFYSDGKIIKSARFCLFNLIPSNVYRKCFVSLMFAFDCDAILCRVFSLCCTLHTTCSMYACNLLKWVIFCSAQYLSLSVHNLKSWCLKQPVCCCCCQEKGRLQQSLMHYCRNILFGKYAQEEN